MKCITCVKEVDEVCLYGMCRNCHPNWNNCIRFNGPPRKEVRVIRKLMLRKIK